MQAVGRRLYESIVLKHVAFMFAVLVPFPTQQRAVEPPSHKIIYLTRSINIDRDWRAVEPQNKYITIIPGARVGYEVIK